MTPNTAPACLSSCLTRSTDPCACSDSACPADVIDKLSSLCGYCGVHYMEMLDVVGGADITDAQVVSGMARSDLACADSIAVKLSCGDADLAAMQALSLFNMQHMNYAKTSTVTGLVEEVEASMKC